MSTTTAPAPTKSPAGRVVIAAAVIAVAGTLACVLALFMGGGAKTTIVAGVANPGSGTIWGAPLATLLVELCALVTVGCVLAATWLIPSYTGALGRTSRSLMVIASATGFVWFLATIVSGIFTLSDILGSKVTDVFDFNIIHSYVTQVELGQVTLVALIATGIVTLSSLLVTRRGSAAYVLVIATATAAIPAFTGHSSTLGHHNFATASLWFHIVGVVLWVGGLAVCTALAWIKQRDWVPAVSRFSTIALVCFVVVALSGVLNAATRMTSVSQLFTSWYGRIILDKVIVLGVLGWFGYHWRKRGIARLKTGKPTTFTQLALIEVALMGVAVGLGTALARTAPPVVGGAHTSELPGVPPNWSTIFSFQPDWLFLIFIGIAAVLYGWGLYHLGKQNRAWPVGRTISWYLGLVIVFFMTCSGFATYGIYLFSIHMGQHMFLAMVAPLFIVLGSPLSMALDVLPDKGTGQDVELRALIVDVMDSKVTRFLTNPLFVLLFFSLSTYPIYFSSLFGWVMGNHLGHTLMLMHFLVAGLLFYIVVVGVDPIPNRPTAPVRAALLVLTMPVHAAFGVIVLSAKHILGGSYYNVVGLPWNVDLKHEQAIGGGLAWVFGEIPFVLVLGIIFIQWIRSEAKEAKEVDAASGSGDPDDELAAYNDYLSSLNKRAPKK